MEPGEDINWLAQVRRGVAEHCVLALLTKGERYGFELARELGARGQIIASEGTLYPLLARLRRNGLVETSWQESNTGPPRRYYHLTRDGELALANFKNSGGFSATPSRRSLTKGARSDFQAIGRRGRQARPALSSAAGRSAAGRRRLPEEEILAEVHGHIEEGRTGLDPDDAASVRTLLDRVGDPAAIAAEAGAPPPGNRRWDAWAPWLIIFGPVASGLGWVAGVLILWTSPTWSRRDQLIATIVPPAGLVALFFGLVAALRAAADCPGPTTLANTTCTTKGVTLPLGVAILLVVAGLAAYLLPPIHLIRARRQQHSTFA